MSLPNFVPSVTNGLLVCSPLTGSRDSRTIATRDLGATHTTTHQKTQIQYDKHKYTHHRKNLSACTPSDFKKLHQTVVASVNSMSAESWEAKVRKWKKNKNGRHDITRRSYNDRDWSRTRCLIANVQTLFRHSSIVFPTLRLLLLLLSGRPATRQLRWHRHMRLSARWVYCSTRNCALWGV